MGWGQRVEMKMEDEDEDGGGKYRMEGTAWGW